MNSILAFVPARKGSKGVPGKNCRHLAGKPLVSYAIEAAIECTDTQIFVSTDDPDVRRIANDLGIETPYSRPEHLASDTTGMAEVVVDGLMWLKANGNLPEIVTLLQPTSPFRTAADIKEACALLRSKSCPSVVGVSPMWTHPFECVEALPEGTWRYLAKRPEGAVRRQDFGDKFWFINGALYCFWTERFLKDRTFVHPDSELFYMNDINTIDIDTERDFLIADALMSSGLRNA